MNWFFHFVYPNLLYVFLVALGASLVGMQLAKRGRYGKAKQLFLLSFLLDLVMIAGYGAAAVVRQGGQDAIMLALWVLFAVWGLRNYRSIPSSRTRKH